jgi:hypothetical protein
MRRIHSRLRRGQERCSRKAFHCNSTPPPRFAGRCRRESSSCRPRSCVALGPGNTRQWSTRALGPRNSRNSTGR